MAVPFTSRRSRATLGVLFMVVAAGITVLRARAVAEPLATLETVTRMHGQGRASASALANAEYHAAHARRSLDARWSLVGYATQGVLAGVLGLTLLLMRRRQGAA